ncbi:MAG: TIM barrel protein [Deltaproteobacteria bacterium]|jgi:hydroxypyruvate isomerase|nr:TIM barrel protein [Deltaproteobacteria bacterium]
MPRFAANVSTLFTEYPLEERFARAAGAGFRAVEFLFPYEYKAEKLAGLVRDQALGYVLFNSPPGDYAKGERGMAAIPGREAEFAGSLDLVVHYAATLNCPRVHVMAGILPAGADRAEAGRTYRANIALAGKKLAEHGLEICLEPINTRSMPGYFLNTPAQAASCIEDIGLANVKLQFDFFHVQMQEGCVALKFKEYFGIIGHCQLAGAPERHEPDVGELHYPYLFTLADSLGYTGYIGCEYSPANGTVAGLGWLAEAKGE